MTREIDLLRGYAGIGCQVVEKATGILWSREDLEDGEHPQYQNADRVLPPDPASPIHSPYPGCMQQMGKSHAGDSWTVGQTTHFVIFMYLAMAACGDE